MKYVLAILSIVTLVFTSCKKEENNQNSNPIEDSVLDYMPLSVGNYWIYQHSTCDSGEVNCEEKAIDTNRISKDSLINGHLYYKLEGKMFTADMNYFLRDSGDYIVDSKGEVYFTHTDSTQKFNMQYVAPNDPDTLYYWYYQLTKNEGPVVVPLGSFDCLDMRGHFFRHEDNFDIDHNTNNLYSKDVGMVRKTAVFASNLTVLKQELIGFHIEPDGGITP